ncbi:MAG TPA: SDR family oxidoreductase [Pseudonocardiaceae bacterium]|jgi:nucleoside-diphosphate-sugar epimerase|nr:SDR family oxidoreductase [Pseudonocardiaceae bacterium]
MRVFVTGASGWIGSAVVPELIEAGHQVTGLARSATSAEALASAGADVLRGTLDDLDILRTAAAASDGVIHLAFNHEVAFSREGGFEEAVAADRRAIETFGEALAGSGRPLVLASGLLGIAPGRVATEQDGQAADPNATPTIGGLEIRQTNAHRTLALASSDVRSSVVRLAPTVHGDGDAGFVAALVGIARAKGVAAYVGDGANRWPAVHQIDAAHLFRLAVEQAPAGSTLHGAADEGVPIRDIAEVIGRRLNVPVASIDPADAAEHFTWLSRMIVLDAPASSRQTRELLGWQPTQPGLIEDLEKGHYFATPSA